MSTYDQLTYVGHATVHIKMDGVQLLTDPLLRHRIAHLRRRRPYPKRRYFDNLDAVFISHHHRDHLDVPSLKRLGRDTRLIGPPGTADLLNRFGFRHIEEICVGDSVEVGSVRVEAVRADHDSQRTPFGPALDALGFVFHGRQSIYFAGDTDIYPEMAELDDLDIALMPIWGWGPTLGNGHMDPEVAAAAVALIQPRLAIPIHWGAFHPIGMGWLNPVFLTLPPVTFVERASELAPNVPIHVLPPGESITL